MSDYPALICGADPGQAGGLAFLSLNPEVPLIHAHKMPDTRADLVELFKEYVPVLRMAYVERARSTPQMGVTSSFTFGCNYERLVMALVCSGIPVEEVIPQKWQRTLGCLTHGDKRISKARAQMLFPSVKVTNYIADALLIAHYGRLQINSSK